MQIIAPVADIFINDKLCVDYHFVNVKGKKYVFSLSRQVGIEIKYVKNVFCFYGKEVDYKVLNTLYNLKIRKGKIEKLNR